MQARVRRVKLGLAAGATDAECVAKEEVRSPLLPGPSPSRGVWVGSFGGRDLGVGVTIMTLRDMDFARQKSVYGCKF